MHWPWYITTPEDRTPCANAEQYREHYRYHIYVEGMQYCVHRKHSYQHTSTSGAYSSRYAIVEHDKLRKILGFLSPLEDISEKKLMEMTHVIFAIKKYKQYK